jgi:demethylmenaquinone methyltransferase/2-methoxy-6-polyprenyl-1,4-benzoquinol methylase
VSGTRLPTEARAPDRARRIFAGLPARYDLLVELLSFGQNARWRRAMVTAATTDAPQWVVDVATGTGGVARQLARRTDAAIVALDLSPEMLEVARRRVAADGTHRIHLVLGDAQHLPFPDGCFDALTFTYLLRYVPDPAATMRELARVVRPGGRVAGLDFHVPPARWWRLAWRAWTRIGLPVFGGVFGGRAWWHVGAFLGPNIEDHYARHPIEAHVKAWRAAGLEDVEVALMSLGGGVVMSGRRRG